jgi:hypothetical protein
LLVARAKRRAAAGSLPSRVPARTIVTSHVAPAMLNEQITLKAANVRRARSLVRDELLTAGYARDEVLAVQTVVAELLGAVVEAGTCGGVQLTVEPFALLTCVRLRCSDDLAIRDEPFGLRERILGKLTIGIGNRRNPDGTHDLWAEVPRRNRRR